MSFYLRTMRLVNIGNVDARFADHTLRFTDAEGRPVDTLGWLANGGGKSSLESLLFAHLLPRVNDFMQHGDGRALTDYVLDGDTAHVACEWATADPGQILPRRFVTGAVYEWENRRRPLNGDRDKFLERWYCFEPQDGVLDIDVLPCKDGTALRTAKVFLELLRDKGVAHASLRMSATTQVQREWRRTVDNNGIDTELLRYQKDMNHTEGGIEKLFNFKTHEAFIDFLLDVVINPEQPDLVADNLAAMAKTLRRKPKHRLERDFCLEAVASLRPIAGSYERLRQAIADHRSAETQATALAEQLAARAAYDQRRAEAFGTAAKAAENLRSTRDRESKTAGNRARELTRLAAKFAVATAEDADDTAKQEHESAGIRRDAWRLTLPLTRARDADQRARDLAIELERETQSLEPLREEHDAAARHLRSALAAERDRLRTETETALEGAETADEETTRCSDEAKNHTARITELQGTIAQCGTLIDRFESDLAAARQSGAVGPTEEIEAASTRLDDVERTAAERLAALADAAVRRSGTIAALQTEKQQHAVKANELDAGADALQQTVDEVQTRADAITGDQRAQALLESDQIDLWRDAGLLMQQLRKAIGASNQRMIALAVEAAEDQRALESLESTEFLPSTPETERICAYLKRNGIEAHTSWSWLQRTLSPAERAARVMAVPAWATGIVVADPVTRERALAVLNTGGDHSAGFTTITTITELQHGTYTDASGTTLFNAPTHPALHDIGAARAEASRRSHAKTAHEAAVAEFRAQSRTDAKLEQSVIELVDGYDADWIPEQLRQIGALRTSAAGERDRAADNDKKLQHLAEEKADDDRELEAIRTAGVTRAVQLRDVRTLLDQHGPVDEARIRRGLSEQEQEDRTTSKDQAEKEAEAARSTAARLRGEAALLKREAETFASELLTVHPFTQHPDDADPTPMRGEAGLRTLRERVETLRRRYHRETTDSQLTVQLEEARRNHTESQSEFNRGSVDAKAMAATFLADHPDGDGEQLYRRIDESESEYVRTATMAGEAQQLLKASKARLKSETPKNRPRYIVLDHEPEDEPDALARATEEQSVATSLSNEVTELEKRRDGLRTNQERLVAEAKLFDSHATSLREQIGIDTSPPAATPGGHFDGEESAASSARGEMVTALQQKAKAHEAAQAAFRGKIRVLRGLVQQQRFSTIEQRLRDRFVDDNDEAIGVTAEERAQELELRAQQVKGMLEEVGEHQAVLVGQICEIVTAALADLNQAQRTSALPIGMGGPWSGEHFLRIRFDRPGSDDELQRRVIELVDELVSLQESVPGMELVKRAVRAAIRRSNVKVLKPNVAQRVEPWEATALSKLSGGEKLTVNIMLYCTLAKLRAANRGGKASGGILVLDNPIGHASRADLIDLQRQVARAHEVQLFYVTGIEDPGAISQFPNIIRMKNLPSNTRERQYVTIENRNAEPRQERSVTNVRVAGPELSTGQSE